VTNGHKPLSPTKVKNPAIAEMRCRVFDFFIMDSYIHHRLQAKR